MSRSVKNYLLVAFASISAFLLKAKLILIYISSPFIQGWDGAAHQAITEYYSAHIFPSLWGWIPTWYAGMPFPQFYPPAFNFLIALLHHILPFITILALMKIVGLALLFSLPFLVYKLSFELTHSHSASLASAAIGSVWMTDVLIGPGNTYGITIESTLAVGMLSQLMSFVCFMGWLILVVKENNIGRKEFSLSAILLLFLCFMSNAHMVLYSLFFIISWIIIDSLLHRKVILRKYFLVTFLAGLLSACWYIPLLAHYQFFAGVSLEDPGQIDYYFKTFWYVAILVIAALCLAMKKKEKNMILLSGIAVLSTFLFALFSISNHITFILPIHIARWIAPHMFLSAISVGYVLSAFLRMLVRKYEWSKFSTAMFVILLVLVTLPHLSNFKKPSGGIYTGFIHDRVEALPSAIKDPDRLSLVEIDLMDGKEPNSFAVDAYLGSHGVNTIFSNIRESSISSLFLGPIRNTLSYESELWASPSHLGNSTDFYNQDWEKALDRGRFIGINSFIVQSSSIRNWLLQSPDVHKTGSVGAFTILNFATSTPQAEILKYQPILLFMPAYFRERPLDSYDYARFQEALIEDGLDDSLVAAEARSLDLDTSEDLSRFKIAVISDYRYKNIDQAFDRLEKYSRSEKNGSGGHLILIDSSGNPLYERLIRLDRKIHDIKIFPRVNDNMTVTGDAGEFPFKETVGYLRENKIPIAGMAKLMNTEVRLIESNDRIETILPEGTGTSTKIIHIKRSYFPEWIRVDSNEPAYLATPTYMLTFSTSSFALTFVTPKSVSIGWIISFLTLLYLSITFLAKKSKKT